MRLKLQTIIASTRPGRIGPAIASWFHEFAVEDGRFEAALVDLATFNLPVFDEPHHPSLQKYEHNHTKKWSESVKAADAYVFVSPEYNYSSPPALVNALDYVYKEWNYKPAGIVSYGGLSGGGRGAQMTKLLLTTLKVVPIVETVPIVAVRQQIDAEGNFAAGDLQIKNARLVLDELLKWAGALKLIRST